MLQGSGKEELLKVRQTTRGYLWCLCQFLLTAELNSIVPMLIFTIRCLTSLAYNMQILDYASLPHFCRREGSGSSGHSANCFSFDHAFHQQLYNYIKQQAVLMESIAPIKQGSFHVDFPEPDPEGTKIAKTIESELQKCGNQNGLSGSIHNLKVSDD